MAFRSPRSSRAMRVIDPTREDRDTRMGWRLASVGLQTSSEVGAGVALGWVVDHYAGWTPWGLLVGGIVGIVVALFTLIRMAWRVNTEMDRADAAHRGQGPERAKPTKKEPS